MNAQECSSCALRLADVPEGGSRHVSLLVGFVAATLFSTVCLWAAMELTRVNGTLASMFLISAICAAIGLVPIIGWLAAFVAMFFLIRRFTGAPIWPDAVLLVIVSRLVAIAATALIGIGP
jgi:hypothetical protein